MQPEADAYHPLEPGQLWVMRIRAWMFASAVIAASAVGGFILGRTIGLSPLIPIGGAVALMIWPALIAPASRFRSWGWKVDAEELHLRRGVFTKLETIVPFKRAQHIDVSQSALERAFHVTSLVLHTAGTIDHRVVLPGLSRETAESIRDDVRAVIARETDAD